MFHPLEKQLNRGESIQFRQTLYSYLTFVLYVPACFQSASKIHEFPFQHIIQLDLTSFPAPTKNATSSHLLCMKFFCIGRVFFWNDEWRKHVFVFLFIVHQIMRDVGEYGKSRTKGVLLLIFNLRYSLVFFWNMWRIQMCTLCVSIHRTYFFSFV